MTPQQREKHNATREPKVGLTLGHGGSAPVHGALGTVTAVYQTFKIGYSASLVNDSTKPHPLFLRHNRLLRPAICTPPTQKDGIHSQRPDS